MCFVFCVSYFVCILCSKATVRAHLSLVCLVQLPGLLCYCTTVLLLLNKTNDDDDDDDVMVSQLSLDPDYFSLNKFLHMQ